MAGLRVVGKSIPRVDGAERVTGRAIYTSDVQLPGMLYARVLRSPHAHARIKSIDTSRAEAEPGVRAVVSSNDPPPVGGHAVFERVVRFAGDEVAAVAADDRAAADEALALIDVEYEPLPFVLSAEEALLPGAPRVQPEGNVYGGKARQYSRGDVERGLTEADEVVKEVFHTQSALHNCLETHGVVAAWEGDQLTVWESTQAIYRVLDEVAEAFGLPSNKVRVVCQYMGGGFGSKQYSGKWSIIAALLARRARRPVRLMLDRREENLCTGNRAPTSQTLTIGARRDGALTAIDLVAASAVGAYGRMSLAIEGPVQVMYACPNVRTEVRSVFTNTGTARSFRGPGYVEGAFPLESLMDELASRLKIDPLEIRLKNYAAVDQRSGRPYSAKHLDECYRRGAELIGWTRRQSLRSAEGTKLRGLGMASQTWGGGGGPPAFAWVRLNSDGTAEVITGSQDIGTGTRTVFAQIAAEELGLEAGEVSVRVGDTAAGPYAPVSWGSMTVSSVGPAIRQAALDAVGQLREMAAGFLSVPAEQTEVRGGAIYVRGEPKPRMSVAELAAETSDFTILGRGAREANATDVEVRTFGAQFADVEVDTRTGEVNVVKIATVHDCGRVMNPLGGGGQCQGAVIQGIGFALTEERVVDRRTGIVLNPDLSEYLVPTALDFADIGYGFVDIPDQRANNLGAKGLGEPSMIPTAPAIANAIAHAVGVRFTSLPMSRDRVIEGLRYAREDRR